jgi:DNA-binding MarR family transcriptional regulator
MTSNPGRAGTGLALQEQMIALIRAFGLHQPDHTPCGQPVPVAEAHALLELTQEEPLSQTDLCLRLRLEKSTVSRLVGQLEGRGWIARQRAGRAVRLRLTDAGRITAATIAAARQAKFDRLLEAIPDTDREPVIAALKTLVEALRDNQDDRPSEADDA